ncbi:hypothetical protein ACSX1A_15410 [Pontibacter sp. MBLB2868]|uniref:hypothetical protein n=1 Tax=Pontibacter sp. MBLB2868 TaxID=3451555 RepID=UPI003F753593
MKRTYAMMLSGALFLSLSLYSCGTDNTTGVDTETTENEVDGRLNDEDEGMIEEQATPLDTTENMGTETDTNEIEM